MGEEKIGGQAAFLNNRVLFYQGNVLVDAVFDQHERDVGVAAAATGRTAAAGRGQQGQSSVRCRSYLPKQDFEKNTVKYILGPLALDRIGSPLAASAVDFKSGAEVVIGKYAATAGDATLMLIEYPTPQIATEKLKADRRFASGDAAAAGRCVHCRCRPVLRRTHRPDRRDRGWSAVEKRSAIAAGIDQLRG